MKSVIKVFACNTMSASSVSSRCYLLFSARFPRTQLFLTLHAQFFAWHFVGQHTVFWIYFFSHLCHRKVSATCPSQGPFIIAVRFDGPSCWLGLSLNFFSLYFSVILSSHVTAAVSGCHLCWRSSFLFTQSFIYLPSSLYNHIYFIHCRDVYVRFCCCYSLWQGNTSHRCSYQAFSTLLGIFSSISHLRRRWVVLIHLRVLLN